MSSINRIADKSQFGDGFNILLISAVNDYYQ
jgi:hypothetical protein